MNTRTLLTLIAIVALVGGATYAYFTNSTAKQMLDEYVLGTEEPEVVVVTPPELWVYELADPTGSGRSKYAIPRIDTVHVGRILDHLFRNGGGRYWLSHMDDRSANNPVLYLDVPAAFDPFPKVERNGQNSYSWQKTLEAQRAEHDRWKRDSVANATSYHALRARFLQEVHAHLHRAIYVRSPRNHATDAIGALNAAFRSLGVEDGGPEAAKKFVVPFSDLEHTAATGEKLIECPDDIAVVAINPKPGASRKVIAAVEVDHPDRLLRLLEQASRPATTVHIASTHNP